MTTTTLTITDEEKKILFRMIKLVNAMRYQGEFSMSDEEFNFINGKLMMLY